MMHLMDKLEAGERLAQDEFLALVRGRTPDSAVRAAERARAVARRTYGDRVYVRALVEFTNYCRNDCLYCGIRRGNGAALRYRLAPDEILTTCDRAYAMGFRTFVLQGGEDPWFTDDRLVDIVSALRRAHPDCAITLSVGERSRDSYVRLFAAGANRYLLRHETADAAHYAELHPPTLTLATRLKCLRTLRELGFQTGCGFMVGSPGQTPECLAEDLAFIQDFEPQMVGIGPFIPHHQTPLAGHSAGSVDETLYLLSLIRLMLPRGLLPATTALETLDPAGREKGVLAGANVLMPNLSPDTTAGKYSLYDGKSRAAGGAEEFLHSLRRRMAAIGYTIVMDRGDHPDTEAA